MMASTRGIGSKVILELASNTNEESTDSYFLSEFDLYETHTVRYRAQNHPIHEVHVITIKK
jgi:hypothetical protein